ncbi:MAG: MarR family transcriptional regulator [Gemmatimonadaceae bacterium]
MNHFSPSAPDATRHPGDVSASGAEVMFSLIGATRAIEDQHERARSPLSSAFRFPKLTVLTKLVEAGEPLTLSEIAIRLACVRSNVTQLVVDLPGSEADGLVRRVDHASDRRSIRAELTQEGRSRQELGSEVMGSVTSGLMSELGLENKDALLSLLSKIS